MTVRDFTYYQYNTIRSSYRNNMLAVSSRQRPSSVQTQRARSILKINQVSRANSDSLQFLNQYKSKMNGLKSAAGRIRSLSKDSVWSNLQISSSDKSIVSNATTWGKVPQRAQYNIGVKQLAKRQISQITVKDIDFTKNSEFIIKLKENNGNEVTAAIKIDTKKEFDDAKEGDTTNELDPVKKRQTKIINDIVEQINQYESKGIRASLVNDDKGNITSIQIEGEEPGVGKTFEISSDVKSTTEQEAQSLIYTLNGEEFTSGSNHNVQIDPSGDNKHLRLNFDGVGHATVKADVDTDKLAKYTEKFADTYNQTVDFLVDHAHRGSGVSRILDRLMQAPIDPNTMAEIGLHFGEDGKLSFEADEFQKAMEEDTRKVYDVLADNCSVADTIYQEADKASNYSAALLLDKSQLKDNNGGIFIINNYNNYFTASNSFYPAFPFAGPLFFSARV